jgi:hypothetical protein
MKNGTILSKFLIIIFISITIIFAYLIKNLIDNNQTKSLVMQIKKINSAVESFTQKYHALPGDIQNTMGFGISIYNSDGNGDNYITDSRKLIDMAEGEIVNFWMHLSNSQMLNEKYDGFENEMARTASTFPESKIGNAGIIAFSSSGKTYLQIGFSHADTNRLFTKNNTLTTKEAFSYDKKVDDENPYKGNVVVTGGDVLNYTQNSICARGESYDINNSKPSCQLRIELKE